MIGFYRPRALKCLTLAVTAAFCQSGWALATPQTDALARYLPVQDQLCNYCRDYSAEVPASRAVTTLYLPGIGYPAPIRKGNN